MEKDNRHHDIIRIESAYKEVIRALSHAGLLLRTTEAGKFMWSSEHKTIITGLKGIVEKLYCDLPDYEQD
jgi:hypothetical protein